MSVSTTDLSEVSSAVAVHVCPHGTILAPPDTSTAVVAGRTERSFIAPASGDVVTE